ncbi:Putative transmembrane protein [Citrifermentans bremense]|uniref:Transmembrane protein n=1 Tax=Citrifermentans bremense TaxID=60035 RepID=A0A6S6LVN6_9BACT|nr:YfiR family protein [Citrifermentans bremense]BCG45358.1 Putative transmembrane protein [Citrifermentans bremense]
MLSLLLVVSLETRAEGAQEYQVKAAMVVNMAKYVEWPAESFPRTGAPLQLCSMGRGPFTQALEQYEGKTVLGHPLSLRGVAPGDDLSECHVLVLSGVEKRYVAGVLEQVRRRGVLTVSDIPDFARFGGIIGLVENEGRVRFEINLKAAQQSRVRISSQLLKLARVIREGDQ